MAATKLQSSPAPWERLEGAFLEHRVDDVPKVLEDFPAGETRSAATFIVKLIEDDLDIQMFERFLADHFAADSPWPPKFHRLLDRLRDSNLEEHDPRAPYYPSSALAVLEQEDYPDGIGPFSTLDERGQAAVVLGHPELDFIKRSRLERQLREWNHRTVLQGHRLFVSHRTPVELGFRLYAWAEDTHFLSSTINQRLIQLGSSWACFFAQMPQPLPERLPAIPLAIHLWPASERRRVKPEYPFRSVRVPGRVTEGLLIVVDAPVTLGGLKGLTEPLGGGVSFVFGDEIRARSRPLLSDWSHGDPDPGRVRFPKVWELRRRIHRYLQEAYGGSEERLIQDALELTTIHELAHQSTYDLLGHYTAAGSKLDFGAGSRNVLSEGIEILADLPVLHALVEKRDHRMALLAAYEGLEDGWAGVPAPGSLLTTPYGWKAAILLRTIRWEPDGPEFDFNRVQTLTLAFEQHVIAALRKAQHNAVISALIEFLVTQDRIIRGDTLEQSFHRLRDYVAMQAKKIRDRNPAAESYDAESVSVLALLNEMHLADPPIAAALVIVLTQETPQLHRALARELGAHVHDSMAFEAFLMVEPGRAGR